MRKLNQLIVFLLIGSVMSLTSCSSDDDGGSSGNAASGTLSAKVDGASYQSLEISSSATIANSGSAQTLLIIATNSDGKAFSFNIFNYEGVGTYMIDGDVLTGVNVASYSETDVNLSNPQASTTELWQAPYENLSVGSISISEETDTKILGTFEFTCKNLNGDNSVKNITDGSFNLDKQVQ